MESYCNIEDCLDSKHNGNIMWNANGNMEIMKRYKKNKIIKAPRNYFQRFFNIETKYNYTVKYNNTETNFDNFPDLLLFLLLLNRNKIYLDEAYYLTMHNVDDKLEKTMKEINELKKSTIEEIIEDNDKNTKIRIDESCKLDKFTISDGFNSEEFFCFEFFLQSLISGEYRFNISETDIEKLTHISKKKTSWLGNLFI